MVVSNTVTAKVYSGLYCAEKNEAKSNGMAVRGITVYSPDGSPTVSIECRNSISESFENGTFLISRVDQCAEFLKVYSHDCLKGMVVNYRTYDLDSEKAAMANEILEGSVNLSMPAKIYWKNLISGGCLDAI